MTLILPEGAVEATKISKKLLLGSTQDKFLAICVVGKSDLAVTEFSNEQYELLEPVLKSFGVDYKVVINIPGVVSPSSFIFEEAIDKIISYDVLELKEKSDADKLFDDLQEEEVQDLEDLY